MGDDDFGDFRGDRGQDPFLDRYRHYVSDDECRCDHGGDVSFSQ